MAFLRTSALVATLMAVTGCEQAEWTGFSARHSTYRFAAAEVVATEAANRSFIRVSPQGEPFQLLFDSRIDGQMDARGYRRLFPAGDSPLAGTTYRRTASGVISCRTGVAAIECGLPVVSGGDQWSMLFPAGRKDEVAALATRARAYLAAHRASGAAPAEPPRHFRCADNSWLLIHRSGDTGLRVERPDLTRTLTSRGTDGQRFAADGFALRLEGALAQWSAPHRAPVPCFDTGPEVS